MENGGNSLEVILQDASDDSIQLLVWSLHDSWSSKNEWTNGRVQIRGADVSNEDPYKVTNPFWHS